MRFGEGDADKSDQNDRKTQSVGDQDLGQTTRHDLGTVVSTTDADVVVIGAGIVGLATAYALRPDGARVAVLEQFAMGHKRGSSHGTARIFKVSYPDAEFVEMAQASLGRWRELETLTGIEILTQTGTIDTGDLTGRCRALETCGATYELLESIDVRKRFALDMPEAGTALFQADGGVLHADRACAALRSALGGNGVEVTDNTRVQHIALRDGFVDLRTNVGTLTTSAVVVTAGAWVNRVISGLGINLNVAPVRETVAYFETAIAYPAPTLSQFRTEAKEVDYGLVTRDGTLKVGISGSGSPTDPEEEGQIDSAVVTRAASWAARHFRLRNTTPIAAESCLYTNAPDERFILERHGRIIIGSACSGHGFKFAPKVGERLAALAIEGASD